MTMAPHIAVRLLALVTCLALTPQFAVAQGGDEDACMRWPQTRLIIGHDLQSRRFVLEAKGVFEKMPLFRAANGRSVYHRPFSISLDVTDRVSVFMSPAPRTCVLARDQDRSSPLKIPVFFVGRDGESLEELKENAENLAFAPSESLDIGNNFADVSFRLRRGGSRFGEIRPYFLCGLPCLLVCEQSCPEDSVTLAASLVNEVVKGKPQVPSATKEISAPAPVQPQAPLASPAYPPAAEQPVKPRQAPKSTPAPQSPQPPKREIAPVHQSPPAGDTASHPSEPMQPPKDKDAAPPPEPARAPAPPLPDLKHLVLAFERKSGDAVPAVDVSKAEGDIIFEGVPLQVAQAGLAADLQEEVFVRANDPENLKKLFRRHRILAVRKEPARIILTVEPLYVRAEDVSVKIRDAAGEPVRGCDLALDVSMERRLGAGWTKTGAKERVRGLEYAETDIVYELNLPLEIESNELLISTEEEGDVARLSNAAPGCELEARPLVSAEEVRRGEILRSLQRTGPTLISVLTADSGFTKSLSPAAIDFFWTDALRLVNVVSTASWEKKVLARAQAPGPSHETTVLQLEAEGGALAGEGSREAALKALSEGSRPKPGPLAIFQIPPIEQFHLDLALKPIRDDAGIAPRHSVKQEALLIVSGSTRETGSYFCQHSVRRDKSPWADPQWVKQARKVFALEVWSDRAVQAMLRVSRIKPAEGAPDGVYVCNIPGAEGDKIALYGIVPETIPDDSAREKVFSYLTAQANGFLKP